MDERTTPSRTMGLPVGTIRVQLTSGPDAGRLAPAEAETLTVGTADGNDLVLRDPTVSRFHLELARHGDRIMVTDHGSTNGTVIGPVLLERGSVAVASGAQVAIGGTTLRIDAGNVQTVEVHGTDDLHGLRGRSAAMRRLMATVERLAAADVSVLLVGESGTGKERVARALHDLGPRGSQPFVVVDCGAIAPSLFQSEIFGHERGAFTGAERRHLGAFERAQGGTVFLDEIGELPAALQPALLGALERRRIRRVGGTEDIPIDVRVVSATHRDLRAAVNAGGFRLDLYYRLATVMLKVPALRERAADVPILVEHFLRTAGYDAPVATLFPPPLMDRLRRHGWPGNVRELRNVVEAAVALGHAPELEGEDFSVAIAQEAAADAVSAPAPASAGEAAVPAALLELTYRDARSTLLREFEERYVRRLLERSGGNVRLAARQAQMDRSYLTALIRRYDVRGAR